MSDRNQDRKLLQERLRTNLKHYKESWRTEIMDQILALSLLTLALFYTSIAKEDEIVEIENGVQIHGSEMTTLNHRKFLAYRGIPYAEPPVEELRFKPPVRKQWTSKIFDATKEGPECVQSDFFFLKYKEIQGQEDCLILNVFTHDVKQPLRKVMVFIHGGAFILGSSKQYGPRRLLDRDVVLVTINYRLGPFGFMSTMDEASPGNYALLDQSEALKWVQRNIAAFGGDPKQVTIFGESAGSVSVMNHVISPVSTGLFQRAIAQSGTPLCPWAEQTDPLYWTKKLANKVDCPNSNTTEIVKCLRKVSVKKLIDAANDMNTDGLLTPFGPVVDGYFHSDLPSNLLRNGHIANRVPLLMGITKDEGLTFTPSILMKTPKLSDEMIKHLALTALNIKPEDVTNDLINLIKSQYFDSEKVKDEKKLKDAITKVITDASFLVPHYEAVEYLLESEIKVFLYSHDYVTDHSITKLFGMKAQQGVSHADDLYFLFDVKDFFPFDYEKPNDETENKFLDIWTSFAENGYPVEETGDKVVNWRPTRSEKLQVYHMDKEITIRNYHPNNDWRMDFWLRKIQSILSVDQFKEEL